MHSTSFLQRPILGLRPLAWLAAAILLSIAVWAWWPVIAPGSEAQERTEQVERRVFA